MDERCYVCLPSSAKHVRVCVPSSSGERVACILKYSNITPLILPKSSCNEIHMFSFNVNKSNMFSLNVKNTTNSLPKVYNPMIWDSTHHSCLSGWWFQIYVYIYIWKHKKCSKPPTQLWHNGSSRSCQRALEDQAQSDMHNLTGEPFRKKISETRVIYELYMGYIWVIYIYIPQP